MVGVPKNKKTDVFLVGLSGLYLLSGAIYSFFTAKWFPGFPVQLDIFTLFKGVTGVYLEPTFALVLGVVFLYFAVKSGGKNAT